MADNVYHFWVTFDGEYIPSQKYDLVQKMRAHSALLRIFMHTYTFFPPMTGDGCHFWIIFYVNSFLDVKKCVRTQAYLGTYAHFFCCYQTSFFL